MVYPASNTTTKDASVTLVQDNGSVHATHEEEASNVKLSWYKRLSLLTTLTLLFTALVIPIVVILLFFLWTNPPLDQTHPVWRNLVLGGWTVETITISTVVLRTAVTGSAA